MKNAQLAGKLLVSSFFLLFILTACNSSNSGDSFNSSDFISGEGERAAQTCVNEQGCIIALSHGAELIVPAGALNSDSLEISIETESNSTAEGRAHNYILGPERTEFRLPVRLRVPVANPMGDPSEQVWCQHSVPEDSTVMATFLPTAGQTMDDGMSYINCDIQHFSTVSAVKSDTFLVYRGVSVPKSAVNACRGRGFASESQCTAAIKGTNGCSYCGGHNKCYIPGGGGGCCPDEGREFNDGCWLGYRNAPAKTEPDACGGRGWSTQARCENSNVEGVTCSFCGGRNECWIPGGGGGCCPEKTGPCDSYGGLDSSHQGGGCWERYPQPTTHFCFFNCKTTTTVPPANRTACGGFGYWSMAECTKATGSASACRWCGGHNKCYLDLINYSFVSDTGRENGNPFALIDYDKVPCPGQTCQN